MLPTRILRHVSVLGLPVVLALFVALAAPIPVAGQWLRGQAVTWTDFNYVYAVTSSISHVYFATDGGIIRYNKSEQRWEEPLTGADGLQSEVATKIWVDQFDNKLYAQTEMGYYEYDLLFARWYPLTSLPRIDNDVEHIAVPDYIIPDFDANYLGNGDFIDYHGRRFSIVDVVNDGVGSLWFGTWGFGGGHTRTSTGLTRLLPYGLLQRRVGVIYDDDSLLWLGGPVYTEERTGLTAFNPETFRFSYLESGLTNDFPAVDVNCIGGDAKYLYVGSPRGLYRFERGAKRPDRRFDQRHGLYADNVLSVLATSGRVFVGTSSGLNMIAGTRDSVFYVRPETFTNNIVYDLALDGEDLWIASQAGAFRYSLSEDRLQRFLDPDQLLSAWVFNVEVHDDVAWFVAHGGVVSLNLKTGATRAYPESANDLDYRALAVNDDVCAVTSNFGFTLIFLSDSKDHSREFSATDGLASNVVYSLHFDGDYLWVGTDQGLTRFLWNNPMRVD